MENANQFGDLLNLYSSSQNVMKSGNLNTGMFILSLLVALVTSAFVSMLYKAKHQGVFFQPSFQLSIICAALITTLVIFTIGGNLILSLGLVGALSIVRFRTAVKDSQDIIYIYWAVAIGMSSATQNFAIVTLGSLVIALAIVGYDFFQSKTRSGTHLLTISSKNMMQDYVESVLSEATINYSLKYEIHIGTNHEFAYEIKAHNASEVVRELSTQDLDVSCYPCENRFGGID